MSGTPYLARHSECVTQLTLTGTELAKELGNAASFHTTTNYEIKRG